MMKSARPTAASIAITFGIAIVFYIAAYQWLSRRQLGKGPWEVLFTNDTARAPLLVVHQGQLGISNVAVRFVGEELSQTNTTGVVRFTKPKMPLPYGRVAYDDLMFLPGDVTIDVFGHLVEILPRHMILNGSAVQWTNGSVHFLWATNKLSEDARRRLKGGYRP